MLQLYCERRDPQSGMDSAGIRLDSDESSVDVNTPGKTAKTAKTARTAKLRKSCEACRVQKARCLSVVGDSSRCQRCSRNGTKCVFLTAKARPKLTIGSKGRVAEMEQRLDELMAMLQAKEKAQNPIPGVTTPPSGCQDPAPSRDQTSTTCQTNMSLQRRELLCNPYQFNTFSLPRIIVDNLGDVISKNIISFEQAEEYLRVFQSKIVFFPFIAIPQHITLDALRQQKPFLLLAIFTFVSAQTQTNVSKVLDVELSETLARRSIVGGEKSMDLLQGLLVYLAWYQYFFNPKKQQIYQFSQTAVSMAIDLGIHKPSPPAATTNYNVTNLITPSPFSYRIRYEDPELRRTFLGTYYLTSAVAHSLRKPNNLKYGNYVGECSSFFANFPLMEHDHLLQHFVSLQRFQEEVNAAFDYDSATDLQDLDCARIKILLATFNRQLQQFQDSFPPQIWENPQITLTYHTLRIYVHEIAFHTSAPSLTSAHTNTWFHSSLRPTSLLTCLQSCKTYLNYLLALPTPAFLLLTLPDFARLVYALLVLGSFSSPDSSPSSPLHNYHQMVNLHYYLEALVTKTEVIIKGGQAPEYIHHFNFLFAKKDEWHARNVANGGEDGKCMTDLIGDMFPAGMKCAKEPQILEFEGLFDDNGGNLVDFQEQNSDQWTELNGFGSMWNGEIDLGTGLLMEGV